MDMSAPVDVGTKVGAQRWLTQIRLYVLGFPQGAQRDRVLKEAQQEVGYAAFLFRKKAVGKWLESALKDMDLWAETDTVEAALRMAGRNDLWTDRNVSPSGKVYPPSVWDKSQIFKWATPAPLLDGSYPEPWRVSDVHVTPQWLRNQMRGPADLYDDLYVVTHKKVLGNKRLSLWVGLRDNHDDAANFTRMGMLALRLKELRLPHKLGRENTHLLLIDDLDENVLRKL